MSDNNVSGWKRAVFWAITAGVSGVLVFAVLEISLRLAAEWAFNVELDQLLVPSDVPGLGFRLAPNYQKHEFRTEARGLRWRPPDEATGDRTILVLGDSIAFAGGVPYEQSFADRLEAALGDALEKKIVVWNSAVPGYNTTQEAILFEDLVASVQPDLTIVQFCMNDYLDTPLLTAGGAIDITKSDPDSGFSLLGLLYSSRVFFFLKEKFKDLQKTHPEWFPVGAHYIHYIHRQPGWENVKAALLRIQRTASEHGSQLLVVLFPVEQQLRIADRAPQDDLVRFAEDHDLQTLDLYEPFQRRWRDGLYFDYFKSIRGVDKLHLNERGHALAAEQIAGEIAGHVDRYLP